MVWGLTAYRTDYARHIPGTGGIVFSALHRLEEAGWLTSFWGDLENSRRANVDRRTRAGERPWGIETEEWTTIPRAMGAH